MCHTAILPTAIKAEEMNSSVSNLTYIFNRWLKMLQSYGCLDFDTLDKDFHVIDSVLRDSENCKKFRYVVERCRNLALSEILDIPELMDALKVALNQLCKAIEDKAVKRVKRRYADQGMTERYRPLSRRLAKEKIHRLGGKEIAYTDPDTDNSYTTKLVRRIVEKRAAQTVHKNSGKGPRFTNRYRQSIRRATSFSLYNAQFTDYDSEKRTTGTHWKLTFSHGKRRMLKGKVCFCSYEEATEAASQFMLAHPEERRPMSAYFCEHCGKWHIGHDRSLELPEEESQVAS